MTRSYAVITQRISIGKTLFTVAYGRDKQEEDNSLDLKTDTMGREKVILVSGKEDGGDPTPPVLQKT